MISISECNPNLKQICKTHVDFVSKHVFKVIDFYIELLTTLTEIKPNERSALVEKKIHGVLRNHNFRINSVVYKGLFENRSCWEKGKLTNLKHQKNRIKDVSCLPECIKYLQGFRGEIFNILEGSSPFIGDPESCLIYFLDFLDIKKITNLLPFIFDYDWFCNLPEKGEWGPYQLTAALKINACPYCNRQYTHTLVTSGKKKIARPQLDHFLPKAEHPLFGLSFYNMVPSCSTCNSSLKGSKPVKISTHYNPYQGNTNHELMKFSYCPTTVEGAMGASEEIEVTITPNSKLSAEEKKKAANNIELFKLKELYNCHKDYAQEIIRKRYISNDAWLTNIQNTYNGFNLSMEESYRLSFGNYLDERDFLKRPLSKFTKDLAVELKWI